MKDASNCSYSYLSTRPPTIHHNEQSLWAESVHLIKRRYEDVGLACSGVPRGRYGPLEFPLRQSGSLEPPWVTPCGGVMLGRPPCSRDMLVLTLATVAFSSPSEKRSLPAPIYSL